MKDHSIGSSSTIEKGSTPVKKSRGPTGTLFRYKFPKIWGLIGIKCLDIDACDLNKLNFF